MLTARCSEISTPVAYIAASAGVVGTFLSNAFGLDSDTGRRFIAYVNVGTIGSSATVAAKFQWSATSGGTYADITGTAITSDTTGSHVHQIEFLVENVKATYPTAAFVKLQVVIGTANTAFSAVIIGHDPAHMPVTAGTNVSQTVSLP